MATPVVIRRFWKMLENASKEVIAWILQQRESENRVYLLDRDLNKARHLCENEIPWPVVLLLSRYSVKYLFTTKKPPEQSEIVAAVLDFVKKFKRNKEGSPTSSTRRWWFEKHKIWNVHVSTRTTN